SIRQAKLLRNGFQVCLEWADSGELETHIWPFRREGMQRAQQHLLPFLRRETSHVEQYDLPSRIDRFPRCGDDVSTVGPEHKRIMQHGRPRIREPPTW